MAGTVTVAYKRHSAIKVAVVTWISTAGGAADAPVILDGEVLKVITNPGATAPTDNYDITLVDEDGFDIAEGLLANRDTANTEVAYLYSLITVGGTGTDRIHRPVIASGVITFTVAAAGDSKEGTARIYYR